MSKMINLETLAGGAFAERTKQSIQEVMENIADPNTEWKDKRKVTIDLIFTTKDDREMIECDVVAKVKLAPKMSVHTKFILDRTLEGEILASEFKKQIPGQQAIKVDSETGEILEPKAEKENLQGLQIIK